MPKTKKEQNNYRGNTSDFPIIDRALTGEQSAYDELFQKHRARIFRFFMRSTKGNIADSEDFVQETFASTFSKLDTFRKDAAFYTWLCRIATNVFLMSCRRKKYCLVSFEELCYRQQVGDGEIVIESEPERNDFPWDKKGSDIGGSDRALENVPNKITVEKLMMSLPPGYKKILALHDLQGFEYKEVATIRRCSPGNAKSQRHQAIMKLRAAVQTARVSISTNSTLGN